MVGRELHKIRPYGEDHLGLVRGIGGVGQAGRHNDGKEKDALRK